MVLGTFSGVLSGGEDGVGTACYDRMIRGECRNSKTVLEPWGMTE